MKKYIIAISAAALAFAACTVKEEFVPAGEKVITTVEAFSAPELKTSLGEKTGNSYPVYWNAGDGIIINGIGSQSLGEVGEHCTSASFTFDSPISEPYSAGYPDYSFTDYTDTSASVILPATQSYVAGSFDPDAAIMVGKGDAASGIHFVTPMAFLRVTIKAKAGGDSDKIASIKLTSVDGETLSGYIHTDFSDSLSAMAGGVGEVTLVATPAIDLGTPAIIAVPAQNYAHGLIIKVSDDQGHIMSKRSADNCNMQAGHIYNAEFDFEPTGANDKVGIYDEADLIAFLNEADGLVECPNWYTENPWVDTIATGSIARWIDPVDGEVHIYNDITLSKRINWSGLEPGERYCSVSNFAPGWVLNGEGHTITADFFTPMFINVYGTIKNLKFAGTMADQRTCELTAPVACSVQNGGLIEGVDNYVDITDHYPDDATGSTRTRYMAGIAYKTHVGATIKNCKNYGTISDDGRPLGVMAGIVSINYGTIDGCTNYASVVTSGTNPTGGICFWMMDGEIKDCTNEASYSSTVPQSRFAGIAFQMMQGTISNCVNNGAINQQIDVSDAGGMTYSGGIVAVIGPRTWTTNGQYASVAQDTLKAMAIIQDCINNANITFTLNGTKNRATTAPALGGIVSWINARTTDQAYAYIKNCENHGTLTMSSKVKTGSFFPGVGGIVGHAGPYGTTGSNTTPPVPLGVTNAQAPNGSVTDGCYFKIENCSNYAIINAKNLWSNDAGGYAAHWQSGTGGIVGIITGNSQHLAEIIGCTSSGMIAAGGWQTSKNRGSSITVNGESQHPIRASRTVNVGGIAGLASFVKIENCVVNTTVGSRDNYFARSSGGVIGAAFGRFEISGGSVNAKVFYSNHYQSSDSQKWFGLAVGNASAADTKIVRTDFSYLQGSAITGVNFNGWLVNDVWYDTNYYDVNAGNYTDKLLSEADTDKNLTSPWCTVSGNTWSGTSRTSTDKKTLTFNFNQSSNPYGWPTSANTESATWEMQAEEDGNSYEFARTGGYLASKDGTYYFALGTGKSGGATYLGTPAIEGYTLRRAYVTLGNTASSRNFGISANGTIGNLDYVEGGSLLTIPQSQAGPFGRMLFEAQSNTRYWLLGNTLVIKTLTLDYIKD